MTEKTNYFGILIDGEEDVPKAPPDYPGMHNPPKYDPNLLRDIVAGSVSAQLDEFLPPGTGETLGPEPVKAGEEYTPKGTHEQRVQMVRDARAKEKPVEQIVRKGWANLPPDLMERWPKSPKAVEVEPCPFTTQGENYAFLAAVLVRALDQAAKGKGAQRHSTGQPFEEQPMLSISRLIGAHHGLLYQAIKKAQESTRMDKDAAVRELLGAINYLAGAIIYLEEKCNPEPSP